MSTVDEFNPLFRPQTVAVVGASATGTNRQNVFIRRIRRFGYAGTIYPIHPTAGEIEGLPAYSALGATPLTVDYAHIAIPAARIPPLLAGANGRVRFAQVISSGFAEVAEGVALEQELVRAARAGGMRLLGPNCLGTYTPRGGITFTEVGPQRPGSVGIVSQSGGLGIDIIRRGINRGIGYSGVVTVGNCADVGASDLLEFYLADPETKVVGLYLETARDGRRLFEILRAAKARKPIIVLKGGRTHEGTAAAASHTGSLAGDDRVWLALSRQTGCVLVETLDELLDALMAFQMLTPSTQQPLTRVALFGNGGGTSVLATDYFSRLGLKVSPFDAETTAALDALGLPPGSSTVNPVDCPAGNLRKEPDIVEKVLEVIYRNAPVECVVVHLNMTNFANDGIECLERLLHAALRARTRATRAVHFALVLRSDGEPSLEELKHRFRTRATSSGVPVFDELSHAGRALAALRFHERFVVSRTRAPP